MRTIEKKFQEKFENFWLRFVGEVAFWNFRSHRVRFFFQIQKMFKHMPGGSKNQNLKEIRALGSEIIAMDGRWTRDKFQFHELCWHSQAELKYCHSYKGWCGLIDNIHLAGLLWTKFPFIHHVILYLIWRIYHVFGHKVKARLTVKNIEG